MLHKFLARGNKKGYKSHIDGTGIIPTKAVFQQAKGVNMPNTEKIEVIKECKLALMSYKDLVLSISSGLKV